MVATLSSRIDLCIHPLPLCYIDGINSIKTLGIQYTFLKFACFISFDGYILRLWLSSHHLTIFNHLKSLCNFLMFFVTLQIRFTKSIIGLQLIHLISQENLNVIF